LPEEMIHLQPFQQNGKFVLGPKSVYFHIQIFLYTRDEKLLFYILFQKDILPGKS